MPEFPDQDPDRSSKDPSGNDGERGPNQGGDGQQQRPAGPFMSRGMLTWIILFGAAIALFFIMSNAANQSIKLTWTDFYNIAKNGKFEGEVVIKDEEIIGKVAEGFPGLPEKVTPPAKVSTKISLSTKEFYVKKLEEAGQPHIEEPGGSIWPIILIQWAPFIIIALLIYFFIFRSLRNAGGGPGGMLGNFGRSRHKVTNKEHSNVTLDDVAGIDEAREEVQEIIEFLKSPKKFQRLGGRVPRGVLLIGSPGCGKTLLAKAVAGEADVPFFSISGSDFVEMFVGVGASRVRDLFKQAKDSSPCIIFLDEIDAVGRRRGSGFTSGGHDEREQTLNAILVEMDGFETNDQVIVVAATNRSDVLDPALTRPGRFDRQIHVPLPDLRGRVEILRVHARRVKMGPDVDLERLARGTPMFSGADLAAIINEAAIRATLLNKDFVEQDDLEESRDKVKFGRQYKSRKIEEEERIATAYHEAGHAVVQWLLPDADPVHKVTIIPRGSYLGATFSLPEKDRLGYGKKYVEATMRVLCAGRIAEQRKTADVTSGAAMDIRQVTEMARHMILEWGMSDQLGFVDYSPVSNNEFLSEKPYSDDTARTIDSEVKGSVDTAYTDAVKMIEDNWDKVVAMAEALLKYETLSSDEVDRLMRGETLNKPTVADLLKAEKDKADQPAPAPPQPTTDESYGDDAPGAMPSPA